MRKNFDLSTFWQGVGGIYRYSWETSTDIRGNLTERWLDRYSCLLYTSNNKKTIPKI